MPRRCRVGLGHQVMFLLLLPFQLGLQDGVAALKLFAFELECLHFLVVFDLGFAGLAAHQARTYR